MTKNLCGIVFDEMPNSIWTPDSKLTIMGTDGHQQSFFFGTGNIAPFTGLFTEYNCASLTMSAIQDPEHATFDLDLITNDQNIEKIQIRTDIIPVKFKFSAGKIYFPNLRSLSISRDFPDEFPDLKHNESLKNLVVSYEKHLIGKWNELGQIADLVIYDYNETDLTALSGLTGVRRLELVSGNMTSLKGLESMPHLETLILNSALKLRNLDAILTLTRLHNLKIARYKKMTDYSFLAQKKDLECLAFDTADSLDFISQLPSLEFLFCKKVKDRGNKSVHYQVGSGYDDMEPEGVVVPHERIHRVFIEPLD